ncbi:MAG: Transcriptional regulator, AcrR family [uncultured Rubrobacteraceae bacterium]|uniref:Transcriptional regulator, AcrR family n=1 Tax=uncultured Rubrobacteraceae bacterium TaxID=349277 RepID=A0A6J4QXB4_9ACTN|nr:MAG: Transcriptional regulator, AcrR family [uncultured Rubrobacteraceae bacterium]
MKSQTSLSDDLRADAARNRARVLEVARERLAAGDAELPMNTIARDAGVGVGTVYRHFPSREALLESLAMGGFERLVVEARKAADDDNPGAGLERLLRYGVRSQIEDVGLAAVLRSSGSARAETSRLRGDLLEAVGRLLERAREAGAIRPGIGADDIRRLSCGIVYAVRVGDGDLDEIERYADVLVDGIRPRS